MNELCNLILLGEFEKANLLEIRLTDDEAYNCIMEGAIDSESIMFYLFYLNRIVKNENARDHYFASIIFSQALNFLEGACDQALYHAKKAMQMDKNNMGYKEYYLFFYRHPDLTISVSDEEFKKCCDDLLEFNINNKTAKYIKNKL